MKLIDLLVQELPKHGGWPVSIDEISMHEDGDIFFDGKYAPKSFVLPKCSDGWGPGNRLDNTTTRKEYETALAASESSAWNGEGVPPVGLKCQALHCFSGARWQDIIVKWKNDEQFLYEWVRSGHPAHHLLGYVDQFKFRRFNEIESLKEGTISGIASFAIGYTDATIIYDAIAAGKIPGVKLAD